MMSHNISASDDEPMPEVARPARPRKRRTKEEIAADAEAKRRAKAERDAERMKERARKPGECLKFFEAAVDVALVEHRQLGPPVLAALRALPELTVRLCNEPLFAFLPPGSGAIRWRRRSLTHTDDWRLEPHSLIIFTADAFKNAMTDRKTLPFEEIIVNITQLCGPPPVIIVFGKLSKSSRGRSDMAIDVNVFHKVMIELQLRRGVSVHALESSEEVARLARCVTKGVAEFEYRASIRSSEAIFGCTGMNAPNIKISDKDPQSFSKLWRQQLMQINLVTGEVADAIVAEYRTPRCLAEAFQQCDNAADAIRLLADLEVRRGAGLLQTKRRIGKELARRLYELLTSEDPEHVIR